MRSEPFFPRVRAQFFCRVNEPLDELKTGIVLQEPVNEKHEFAFLYYKLLYLVNNAICILTCGVLVTE